MKISILGHNGFLGSMLAEKLSQNSSILTFERSELDLAHNPLLEKFDLKPYDCRYVVICAAITDVETCFTNREQSEQVNVNGTRLLLQKTMQAGATPIFFSTDYVFKYREQPLKEEDEKNPLTVYGAQKLKIEEYIKSHFENYLIFRTSKLMSKKLHAKNILTPIIQNLKEAKPVKLFEDQWLNPVFTEDIADLVEKSIHTGLSGEFHLGTRTVYNRFSLGQKAAEILDLDAQWLQPSSMKDIHFSEPRPSHNVLDCQKIEKALDFKFTELEDGLRDLATYDRRI